MIERVYIKDYLSLKEISLDLKPSLSVFTGESGAGKSIFMEALLSVFGLKETSGTLVELSLNASFKSLEEFGILNDEPNILKCLKEKNLRFFINNQALSRKNMQKIISEHVRYLSVRDLDEFSCTSMLDLLDRFISKNHPNYAKLLLNFSQKYEQYLKSKKELDKIICEEQKIQELKEFALFEIEVIENVNPQISEDEELLELKKDLSRREKISQSLQRARGIFEYESEIYKLLEFLNKPYDFFDECMNTLRAIMDEGEENIQKLENLDIEALLGRLEQISKLKSRFSKNIEEILLYKQERKEQLKYYENIFFEKANLQKTCDELNLILQNLADEISKKRHENIIKLEERLNFYLSQMYLKGAKIIISSCALNANGRDLIEVKLDEVDIKKISSGELNRIRLANIAMKNELLSTKGGVLILDEIDANLSGKEAFSVANVITQIAKNYQILAISHQPGLSSVAKEHFKVSKTNGVTSIKKLDFNARIDELARMISGKNVTSEAKEFAKKLLNSSMKS